MCSYLRHANIGRPPQQQLRSSLRVLCVIPPHTAPSNGYPPTFLISRQTPAFTYICIRMHRYTATDIYTHARARAHTHKYTRTHTHAHAHARTHMHTHTHAHSYTRTLHTHTHTHTDTYTNTHICTCTRTHTHIHAQYTYTHTRTHTLIHTHTHTHTQRIALTLSFAHWRLVSPFIRRDRLNNARDEQGRHVLCPIWQPHLSCSLKCTKKAGGTHWWSIPAILVFETVFLFLSVLFVVVCCCFFFFFLLLLIFFLFIFFKFKVST